MRARLIESIGAGQQGPKAVDSSVLQRHWDDVQHQVSVESSIRAAEPLREAKVIRHVRFAYD